MAELNMDQILIVTPEDDDLKEWEHLKVRPRRDKGQSENQHPPQKNIKDCSKKV